jgi:hypothetical protein
MWWPVKSGTTVRVDLDTARRLPDTASVYHPGRVLSTGSESRSIEVVFDDPAYVNTMRKGNGLAPVDDDARSKFAVLAALSAARDHPDFFQAREPLRIDLDYDALVELDRPQALDDRAIRRYLAQRYYLAWQAGGFDALVTLEREDTFLAGAGYPGFLRNLQLLEQEGYLSLHRTMATELSCLRGVGKAKLIREVERFGGPQADVESEPEFAAIVRAVPGLAQDLDAILVERSRYELARSAAELVSVFRALMPIVEGTVRRLLGAVGSTKSYSSLGPMIGELRGRSLGSIDIWSQLAALQNNVRDISLHGGDVSTGMLRVACETCFGVLADLGRLFPRG